MKSYQKIHNIDSLEREIRLLDLKSKLLEEKLSRNFNHLQKNCLSMSMNSIFCNERKAKDPENSFWKTFLKTNGVREAVHTFSETVAGKAAGVFADMAEKIFHKKER